jgi:hypothetical protein
MNLKKIFFSYSRTDASDFTLRLALDLKKEGFDVWIDQEDIRAGSEWDLEIEKALETCDCLLFIESEKSVASTNVLDEVYYAMEQHKRVIPVIYKDSKTPFRIQRLQHIDFSKDYPTGLANLINELKGVPAAELLQPGDGKDIKIPVRPFFTKSPVYLLIIALLVIIATVAVIYAINNKKETRAIGETVNRNEPVTVERITDVEPARSKKGESDSEEANEKKVTSQSSNKIINKADNKIVNKTGNKIPTRADDKIVNLNETFAGNWELADVEPKAASNRGYLRIEEIDEKKVKIQSNFQFYFFKTNESAFFVVFNGYAACSSCVLQNELKITDKDIAFGTNKYEILKEDQPGGGKAGDTISTAGANNSIQAFVTLHLIDKNTVIIKVQQSASTPISNGLTVKPFAYSFRFRKSI